MTREIGLAVRVIVDGTWGFASHAELDPRVAADTARRAVRVATTLAALNAERIELAPEPVYADVDAGCRTTGSTRSTCAAADKIAVLDEYSARLLAADGVDHVSAGLHAVKEQTFYADTFGSSITQQRVRIQPTLEAVTVDAAAGTFETMRTLAPPTARGWEVVAGDDVWDWSTELAQLPSLLAEKTKAPSVTAGPTDLVIDPSNLWLTIHESIGHATEYDRAIGYEAAYAGTSFATPDKLGSMRYGSPVMNVTADRTVEFGLATIGFDDEGVRAQSWDLVRDGIFVGYQLDRVFAPRLGVARSNGCSYADSPHHVPIQRMANVSLQPGADDLSTDDLIAASTTASTSSGTSRGRSTCSGTTFSSPGSGSSGFATDGSTGSCATSPTRRRPRTSGVRWRPSAGRRPGGSAARSTAARPSPARSPRSATAARRRCSAASTCSTPARSRGAS